jgi:hypothetical protein
MKNGFFNKPDKIDKECKEAMKNTLAQNKKLELQQIIKTLTNIRLHSKQEIVDKKIDLIKLEEEIIFLKMLKRR